MPGWVWWMPLVGLVSLMAVHFFRLGWIAANLTEGDVIAAYAQRYLKDRARDGTATGARISDCVAYPGEDAGIWLRILCGPSGDPFRQYQYEVDRLGQFVRGWTPHSTGVAPDSGLRRPET
ncbi:hypothetical protein [Antarctobacter sp.]|uniref:hypothetical protein n=1 Tax=Antarctobacter sp. TaxID=1872577 RepID=UPI002B274F17|nr:hypothetical protein [Antarctobacter sp.]